MNDEVITFRIRAKDSALKRAAEMFRFYEDEHRKKESPDMEKVKRNQNLAEMCEYAEKM